MRNSIFVMLSMIVFFFAACNEKPSKNKSDLVGIWQNKTVATTEIEFTANGEYYLWLEGKRISNLSSQDSVVQYYWYDSLSKGINFKIYTKKNDYASEGKLVFLDSDAIKISLLHSDTIVSESEFYRRKE